MQRKGLSPFPWDDPIGVPGTEPATGNQFSDFAVLWEQL